MHAVWALLLIATAGPGHSEGLARGDVQLARGQWRLAEQSYRGVLLNRPKSPLARVGLGRALVMLSRCDEALDVLQSVRHTTAYTVEAALAEARCQMVEDRSDEAMDVLREVVWRRPGSGPGWLALAQLAGSLGDEGAVEEAVEGLRLSDGAALEPLIRAEIAFREGDPTFDGWLSLAWHSLGPSPVLGILDARAWMDGGDPARAEAVLLALLERFPSHGQLAFWRAEAARRLGWLDEASAVFERPELAAALDDPTTAALLARVRVDQGDLDGAEVLLSGLSDPLAAEALASRWYLARARGWETDHLATLWQAVDRAAGRELGQLVPIASGGAR